MQRIHLLVGMLVVLLMALVVRIALIAPHPMEKAIHLPAPDIVLSLQANGPPIHLSDLKGKVVLLDFWATWCEPCRISIPTIEKLYQQYHKDGLVVIGISQDHAETRLLIPQVKKQLGITYPIVVADDIAEINQKYPAEALPTMFLIDRQGQAVKMNEGFNSTSGLEAELSEEIAALLKK